MHTAFLGCFFVWFRCCIPCGLFSFICGDLWGGNKNWRSGALLSGRWSAAVLGMFRTCLCTALQMVVIQDYLEYWTNHIKMLAP